MKRLILGLMVLSSLVFAGDKVKLIQPTVMCMTKDSKLGSYYTLMMQSLLSDLSISDIDNAIKNNSNGQCGTIDYDFTAEVLQKQYVPFGKGQMEYVKLKFLTSNGADVSSSNLKVWIAQVKGTPVLSNIK